VRVSTITPPSWSEPGARSARLQAVDAGQVLEDSFDLPQELTPLVEEPAMLALEACTPDVPLPEPGDLAAERSQTRFERRLLLRQPRRRFA